MTPTQTFIELANERDRQDAKWGEQNHDDPIWLAILDEEIGETAKAILDDKFAAGGNLREEVIQVAAVAVAWLECIDRRSRKKAA